MFERFSAWGRQAVVHAEQQARELRHSSVGPEHLLLGVLSQPEGLGAKVLARQGVTFEAARADVEARLGVGERAPVGSVPYTPSARRALEQAMRESLSLGHDYVGSEHLALALAREGQAGDVTADRLRDELQRALESGDTPTERGEADEPRFTRDAQAGAAEAVARFSSPWDAVAGAHLVLGVLAAGGPVAEFLREQGVTPEALRERFS